MAEIETEVNSNNGVVEDDKAPGKPLLFGRRDIYATADEITAENVIDEVNTALTFHLLNVQDEDYLYWYRRGFQPVLNRTKTYNDFVCNKIVANISEEITTFKNGFFLQEPCSFVSRKKGLESKVTLLNEYLHRSGKQTVDNILADWFHMVGKAVLYVEPNEDEDIPLKAYALDPRSAFVAYSLRPGNKPVFGVNIVLGEYESLIDVYTAKKVFRLKGGASQTRTSDWKNYATTATELVGVEDNTLGHIPIIEYRYNSVNMGCFEACLPLLDAISDIQSNRADGVAQFVQSIIVAVNCQFEEGTTANKIKEAGMIALSSVGENKADFKVLSEELNQEQTQVLVDNLYDQAMRICAMPTTARNGRGTYDSTGAAALYNNGWAQASSAALNTEDLFKESNHLFEEILIDVLKRKDILDIKMIDFELNFTRNDQANMQSKAQSFQTLLAAGLHPQLAAKKSGISNDPVADIKMSEKYLKMVWGDPDAAVKAEEEGNGQGEAQVIEEDNNNGEDAVAG